MVVITLRDFTRLPWSVSSGFPAVVGRVGAGTPVARRGVGRFRRPFVRVRRAAANTSLVVASAQRRWVTGCVHNGVSLPGQYCPDVWIVSTTATSRCSVRHCRKHDGAADGPAQRSPHTPS
jgi:hypothetical protein